MTEKRKPDENQEQKSPEREAEPEGGPAKRVQAFMAQRQANLRPKEEAETDAEPGVAPPEVEEPLSDDFHFKTVQEYRKRQKEQLEEKGELPATPRAAEPGEPPPPEPPQPPPANNWIPIGPSVLRQGQGGTKPATSGRTPGIAVVPGGSRAYIAAANGGVWRTEDTGHTWVPLMEAFDLNPTHVASDSLACGAIAVVSGTTPSTDHLYVGSGEGSGAAYFGVGPLFSPNGGLDWYTEPVSPVSAGLAGSGFYALAVDPSDNTRVVAATRRGIYRREPDGSGGFEWARKSVGGVISLNMTSVVVAREGGVTAYYAAKSGGPVYTSADGDAWVLVGTGFPTIGFGRVTLAVQESNRHIVYAFLSNGDVYRLDTGDGTWRPISGLPVPSALVRSQGWYDLAMAVAPDNVNRIYLGGATVYSGGDWSGALYRCEVTVAGSSVSATSSMIGNSVHADIHAIVFAPGDPDKLWVGCDGGVFYSSNPTGSGDIFRSCNYGLSTLTMNHLDQHPTEDAVVFCGTQDNGGVRFTGEEAWLYSAGGDCGFFVVNWHDTYKVLNTYVYGTVRRSTDGGSRYSYSNVNVPLAAAGENCLFYAPLVGTPPNPGAPSEADIVAFGSVRPWISNTFGGGWASIPNGTLAGDSLGAPILSLVFASATKLYAGTTTGHIYRFDKPGASWTRTRIDNLGGLAIAGPVTDIAIDYGDATGNSVYIAFGGSGDYRHVWHFDGTTWQPGSGPAGSPSQQLLDVQHNAIVTDPAHTNHLYAGADIGIWRSTDSGATWAPYSEGLPDAAVLDLKLHTTRRLLRAATHGRGVYERTLPDGPKQDIELYVRDTQLDQGRFTTVNWLPDPTQKGEQVRHWRGPDIKLDTPDTLGNYQFPLTGTINFLQFVDELTDDFQNVATHATATITTRVYVQVHNRGIIPANGVRLMLLLSNASAGLPALPAGYEAAVQSGTPINTADWQTIGIATLNDVRVGQPKIAAFNLTSDKLPPPANLAGNNHHCVLALVHHPDDPYTSTQTHTDTNSMQERKAAHKNLTIVQFTGTLPAPPPLVIPVQINNADLERKSLSSLILDLNGYRGRVRIYVPPMQSSGDIRERAEGVRVSRDFDDFKAWAEQHIEATRRSEPPFNKAFVRQRFRDIELAMQTDFMFLAETTKRAAFHGIVIAPQGHHTIFVLIDRPRDSEIGQAFSLEVQQINEEKEETVGALEIRVELVPEPPHKEYELRLSVREWLFQTTVIRAQLIDRSGRRMMPSDGAAVHLAIEGDLVQSKDLGPMRWHRSWRTFYYYLRRTSEGGRLVATGLVNGQKVAKAEVKL